jgi:hypothetical protein
LAPLPSDSYSTDFEIRAANTRILADTVVLNFSPVVTDETIDGWNAYIVSHFNQVLVSLVNEVGQRAYQDAKYNYTKPPDQRELQELPVKFLAPSNLSLSPGTYLPIWQWSPMFPMAAGVINFDAMTHPAGASAYREVLVTAKAVINQADNLDYKGSEIIFQNNLAASQYRYDKETFLGDPTSALGYPVFDTFNHTTRKVVGLLSINLYWSLIFRKALPPNAAGIVVIVENNRDQKMTYEINGNVVTYLGPEDLHNEKYDHLVKRGDIQEYLASINSPQSQSYTSAFCSYSIRVYPSQETEDRFVTRQPIVFSIVVASIFLFTSLVFVTYDCLVAHRQRVVMARAVASSASKFQDARLAHPPAATNTNNCFSFLLSIVYYKSSRQFAVPITSQRKDL